MPCHGVKSAIVVVEQWPAVLDAPGANQQVDRLADGNAAPAQRTEITGRYDRNRVASHWNDFEATHEGLNLSSCPLAFQALQYLAKHQIPNDDLVRAEDRAQALDLARVAAIEKVDPDATVDNNHPVPRPLRLRARLPRQRYLPKARSTSRCRRSRIIKRSASSTVCFLVACPHAFWASAMRVSSISILVRIGGALCLCVWLYFGIHIPLSQSAGWPADWVSCATNSPSTRSHSGRATRTAASTSRAVMAGRSVRHAE